MAAEQEKERERDEERDILGALSPSRAADFLACPLRYRFRTIDRLPEPVSVDALRGTLIHRVLELLFDQPAVNRTPPAAGALLLPAWQEILAAEPELEGAFSAPGSPGVADWLESARVVLERWFELEDPTRLEPESRELYVETLLDSKLLLRGYVDRLDVSPEGLIRVVDYKSGWAPAVGFEFRPLFQMLFYALVIWRERGVVPSMLQLVYLGGEGEIIRLEPDEGELRATERKVLAIWDAISAARESGEWQPNRGRLCDWCSFKALCPAWGGTPPPLPSELGDGVALEVAAAPAAPGLDLPAVLAHQPGATEDAGL